MSLLGRDPVEVAPALLGAVLRVSGPEGAVAVRLTEVEAYRGEDDPGSHAFRGRTRRTAAMFGPHGHLYVYFAYGMHWCANIVCGPSGVAGAVLLRAGEVVEGVGVARQRRPAARRDADLARGPGRLCGALRVTGSDDGAAVVVVDGLRPRAPAPRARVALTVAEVPPPAARGPRVGVAGPGGDAVAFPWRFWVPGERTVSAYRPGGRSRRAGRGGAGGTAH